MVKCQEAPANLSGKHFSSSCQFPSLWSLCSARRTNTRRVAQRVVPHLISSIWEEGGFGMGFDSVKLPAVSVVAAMAMGTFSGITFYL